MPMLVNLFSAKGALSQSILGFQARQAQTDMAQAVLNAIDNASNLVVEAGTGTGKTFAYLIPALLSGKKILISTGSKNLQEQLFHRDLPLIINALDFHGTTALLKGRANYLCIDRLHRQLVESHRQETDPKLLAHLVKVRQWSSSTRTGDLAECASLPEDSAIIPSITSTNDNCLGKDCPSFQDCFVFKARKKALAAEVVVVNHHLFLADLALKETGFGELLPEMGVFIFDEAHQLPDIAGQYFGQKLTSRQLIDLAKDIELGYRTEAKDMRQLQKVADRLQQVTMDFRLALGQPQFRGNWREAWQNEATRNLLSRLTEALTFAQEVLKLALGRSQLLDAAFERVDQLSGFLERYCAIHVTGFSYWFETHHLHFSLHITPLSVADKFQEQIEQHPAAWVFTSATLTVNGQFSYFTQRLGLQKVDTLMLDSPFNYAQQARLCVPRYLPEPKAVNLATHLVQLLAPIIEQNQGRCFFLCTSHHMMRELGALFRQSLTLPVLVQGEQSKQQLLNEFVQLGNALLVATGAFWEGVDVPGQALNCVIIDKLPFTSPDDPLLKARIEDCRLRGGEPFTQVQLPDAVIALKQGVGRLIRGVDDQGVVIICDQRLVTRDYGATFLSSLPAMLRTRDLNKISEFLQAIPSN